jgi:hypothetical protein
MSCLRWARFSWMSRCFQRIKDFLSTFGWTIRYSVMSLRGVLGQQPSMSLLVNTQHTDHEVPVIAQFELVPFRVVDGLHVSLRY